MPVAMLRLADTAAQIYPPIPDQHQGGHDPATADSFSLSRRQRDFQQCYIIYYLPDQSANSQVDAEEGKY